MSIALFSLDFSCWTSTFGKVAIPSHPCINYFLMVVPSFYECPILVPLCIWFPWLSFPHMVGSLSSLMTLIFSLMLSFNFIYYSLPIRILRTLHFPLAIFQPSLHYVVSPLHPPSCKYSLHYFFVVQLPLRRPQSIPTPLVSYFHMHFQFLITFTWLLFGNLSPRLLLLSQFTSWHPI